MTGICFNTRKAAQVTAFFANKDDNSINILKLIKLIYLSDRLHIETYGYPITNDRFVSMPHGPVNSLTYSYTDGYGSDLETWSSFIGGRVNNNISAVKTFDIEELDEFSEVELHTLSNIWEKYGHMTGFELVDFTHQYCTEWIDPNGSSNPIELETIFEVLGFNNPEEMAQQLYLESEIDENFASLREAH